MKTSDFYYDLPEELIAQTPVEPRDSSRMLIYDRAKKEISHKHFYDVIDYLNEGDTLIVNDSRVLPARIYGTKIPTGANVEFLLLKQKEEKVWETLVKPGKKARTGDKFSFGDGIMTATVIDVLEDGNKPRLTFTVFVPDEKKAGGKYVDITDTVKRIDTAARKVVLMSENEAEGYRKEAESYRPHGLNRTIDFDKIVAIHGDLVDYMDDTDPA